MVLKLQELQLERGPHRGDLPGRHQGPNVTKGGEIVKSQDAMPTENQHGSESWQERERTLQEEETGKTTDEMGTDESTGAGPISHHRTCCCESCWPNKINLYL